MKYIHIKNLDKYQPGYKDRSLIWCKVYFSMINSDPEFELLDEIDKWRFIAFVMLEIQAKKPILLNETYLNRKGFDFKNKKLIETLSNLEHFIQVIDNNDVTENIKERNDSVTQSRVDKSRVDKSRVEYDFNSLWEIYPKKDGKKDAERHFKSSVKNDKDYENIKKALNNYIENVKGTELKYIKNGSTWFNNWHDWVDFKVELTDDDIINNFQNIYG